MKTVASVEAQSDFIGTILFVKKQEDYNTILEFAESSNWLLLPKKGNKTTFVTQAGILVQIQFKGDK